MADFVPRANDFEQDRNEPFHDDFRMFFEYFEAYKALNVKTFADINNIESVFGAFEVAKLCGRLGSLDKEEIQDAIHRLKRVICRTVERSMNFPHEEHRINPPQAYAQIGNRLQGKLSDGNYDKVAFISFNYDLGLESALHRFGIPFEYGLSDSGQSSGVRVLKLHGSINWYQAVGNEDSIGFIAMDELMENQHLGDVRGDVNLEPSLAIDRRAESQDAFSSDAIIVPPSWNKMSYHGQIAGVWERAARELSEANNVLVFGYSLPQTGEFFRSLLAIGLAGRARLASFRVFDPSDKVGSRFEGLLSKATANVFYYRNSLFEQEAADVIRDTIR